MKQKTILSIILFNLLIFNAFGQVNVKVGYADVEYILSKMPETAKAQAELDVTTKRITKTRDSIIKDYNIKLEDYKKNVTTFDDTIKKEKEDNLIVIQKELQRFDEDVQAAVNYKKNEYLKPIYSKIAELVSEVAKENGYTHILNSQINGSSVLIYAEETTDISDLVIAKANK
ncbi:OmpH family outer membrane protein [Lacinutrix sp.]|uniref:OmpH family outer membrane protein n=1 Tax=Lacinutrix sp. TaxID=1937692 RepID=UPI0025BEAC9A|nr:OmpH family outer membrane protein [Lacinutrix sp.]